ncbi:MAG TPA: histidine phosphatase family protein [Gammaproteobacteria bacterium]|nr:histidine phosphatase family protein [Gammaproteobacteria bacterium]
MKGGTCIDFIRHGEPVGGRRYRGHGIDDPLSERGWRQMWNAMPARPPWQVVASSPLSRCRAFAEQFCARHRLPLEIEPDLREVGFGAWEGLAPDEVQARQPEAWHAFHRDPVRCRPEGAEPLDDFGVRVARVFEVLRRRHAGRHLLVVAHAGVVRAVLGHVLAADPQAWYRARVDNACLSRFRDGPRGLCLEFHNRPRLHE